jgi:hypothetical protein
MTTRLKLYNAALRHIGETKLASLSENRKPRHLMDDVWDGGFLNAVLEQGQWKFAMRTVKIEIDPDVTPSFGYRNAFSKPSDYVKVAGICSDEYFRSPLLDYSDEGSYWYSDLSEIYVQYVSNDPAYGYDLTKWPETFCLYAEFFMASQIVESITQSATKEEKVLKLMQRHLTDARSKDALAGPTKFLPEGNWTKSRRGGHNNRRDGGNRGNLIG